MNTQKIVATAFLHFDGKVLIAKRATSKHIAPGKWHLPGGHVEFGESPEDAIQRELGEEFGVKIQVHAVIRSFQYTDSESHTVGICFLCSPRSPLPEKPVDSSDNDALRYLTRDELDEFFPVSSDHNRRCIADGFALLMPKVYLSVFTPEPP